MYCFRASSIAAEMPFIDDTTGTASSGLLPTVAGTAGLTGVGDPVLRPPSASGLPTDRGLLERGGLPMDTGDPYPPYTARFGTNEYGSTAYGQRESGDIGQQDSAIVGWTKP